MRRSLQPTPPAVPLHLGSVGALVLLAVMWGGSIPITKLGLRDLPPLTLTAGRFLLATPLFLWAMRRDWPQVRQAWAPLLTLGVLHALPGQVLQSVGVGYTSATAATLLSATIPLWFVALATLRAGQRLHLRQWLGLLVAMAGIAVLVVGDLHDLSAVFSGRAMGGNLLILGSAAAVALYFVLSADLSARLSPLVVAAATTVAGCVALVPFSVWELTQRPVHPTAVGWGAVVYLAVLVSYAGLQIWLSALQRVPASVAGALQYLQPIIGVGLSAWLLGEGLTARFAAGAVLVLLGIGAVTASAVRR